MKYKALLDAVKKLHQIEVKVSRISDQYKEAFDNGASTKRLAALSDRLTSECWERDRQLDVVHCELVNAGITEPKPPDEYEPREIRQSAGFGHSINLLYYPPKPNCIK